MENIYTFSLEVMPHITAGQQALLLSLAFPNNAVIFSL